MAKAIDLALENVKSGNGGPFSAIVVKDGEIVGKGVNCVTATNDPTAHAEVSAIRDACKNLGTFQLDNCEIYTTCEPCPMCLGAIYWARPAKVFYGTTKYDAAEINFDDQFIYDEIEKDKKDRSIPMVQIMRQESLEIFKAWSEKLDKIEY
ncbi:MAG: nucleoside deaminase [Bacteroidota bacterium]|nr:nucleoside deaminase [Bacteroidota bacterium]